MKWDMFQRTQSTLEGNPFTIIVFQMLTQEEGERNYETIRSESIVLKTLPLSSWRE